LERQKEESNSAPAYVIKISGPELRFIKDVTNHLKDRFTVILISKPKENDDGSGYHVFLTVVDLRGNE
jgi:hypothetical protein